jgi:hypothetical protein
MSSRRGIGCLYLIVILLIAHQSTHICHVPSFFELKELEQHKVRGFLLHTPCQVVLALGTEFPLSPQDLCGTVAGSGVELLVQDQFDVQCLSLVAVQVVLHQKIHLHTPTKHQK